MRDLFTEIYRVVRSIRRGRVMTYGQVARVVGLGRGARVVGYAMRAAPPSVPWQRVLGQKTKGRGHVTIRAAGQAAQQRILLEKEGVHFSPDDTIELLRYADPRGLAEDAAIPVGAKKKVQGTRAAGSSRRPVKGRLARADLSGQT